MTHRILAWSLLVLAASPFTAPFSTCDLATLFGHATTITLDAPIVQPAPRTDAAMADDAALAVPSLVMTGGRVKLPDIVAPGALLALVMTNDRPNPSHVWARSKTPLPDRPSAVSAILRL